MLDFVCMIDLKNISVFWDASGRSSESFSPDHSVDRKWWMPIVNLPENPLNTTASIWLVLISLVTLSPGAIGEDVIRWSFEYQPGPVDNPLKGIVPYSNPTSGRFPHSMEFDYLPLSKIVVGKQMYDWSPLETMLKSIASRGNQTVLRFLLEYPNRTNSIPQYLIDDGLMVRSWSNPVNGDPPTNDLTPDYEDSRLREMLTDFIAEFGARYDGDPRLGYVTAGLLGTWGEWHNYPKTEWFASKTVQTEVMDAYAKAFKETPVLLRYPAGPNDANYADSSVYRFGYHDDSFAWATAPTSRDEDSWFFWSKIQEAGLGEAWKRSPIGGEVRPEVWGCWASAEPCTPRGQEFETCRDTTHVTWLMETGLFREQVSRQYMQRATRLIQGMGYDLYVSMVELSGDELAVKVENRGIAPFYHGGWYVRLRVEMNDSTDEFETDWSPRGIQPGEHRTWKMRIAPGISDLKRITISLPNPMPGGKPLHFANRSAGDDGSLVVIDQR
ncbi:MAG: hypothetical protein AAF664_04735 [Planctomycetota bacterium]